MRQAGARRDVVAAAGLFFAFGVLSATWISRIPAIAARLDLGPARLGLALLGLPVGSVAASLLVPRLVHGNARGLVMVGMPLTAAGLVLPGFAADLPTLAVALAGFGAASGVLDVSLNTHAAHVERALARSVFGRLHGMWSLGALVGAGGGTAAAAGSVSPRTHFLLTAAVVGVGTVPLLTRLMREPVHGDGGSTAHRGWSRDRAVVVFAVVALAGLVMEVAAGDWSGVFVRTVVGAGPAASAAPFAVFSVLHLTVRLVGDRFVTRGSRESLLTVALGLSAAGMILFVVSTTTVFAFLSIALVGAGVSLVFPMALAGAGQVRGVSSANGVATAAGTSYAGWAAAPPLIGLLAGAVGLRLALLLPVALAIAAAVALHRRPGRPGSPRCHTG